MSTRRAFLTGIGGAAAAWPRAVRAEQAAMPVVGFLGSGSREAFAERLRAFYQGLADTGFVEGRNLAIEYRLATDRNERFSEVVADLVRKPVSLIVTANNVAALAAKSATATIPIVFSTGGDPVRLGLVTSLKRPGGNITGVTNLNAEVAPKRLELLHELLPTASTMALLINPANRTLAEPTELDVQAAARTLGLKLHILNASNERDFDHVFASFDRLQAAGLAIGTDGFLNSRSARLAALTVQHAVPAVFLYREFAAAGGLMSYGGNLADAWHQVGVYAGRILKGEKSADLPVQQATKVQLIINLRTAKALGLEIPPTLLARADEVIE